MNERGATPLWVRAIVWLSAIFAVFPLYWMAATALTPRGELFQTRLHLWPSRLAWENLVHAWELFPYGRWLFNSAGISIMGALLDVWLSLTAGYAFAKFRFRGRNFVFALLLCTLMVPDQTLLAPQFSMVAATRGLDTWWAVILPQVAKAFGVFVARQFFAGIPDELLEAARLDGAGEWTIFWRIVLPVSRPLIAVLLLFGLTDRWNAFAWPLVVLQDNNALTLPVGLSLLQGQFGTDWTSIMAVSLATALPSLAVFAFLQRYIVRGVLREGIK